ncbi:MAG TPA: hypothetical protein VF808_07940 [Ktedonobacterales bacterium]
MDTSPEQENRAQPRDAGSWAAQSAHLTVTEVPVGAVNLNVEGRGVVGPLQGFGPLWQKTYRVSLAGVSVTPAELVSYWKAHFGDLQPRENKFYTPSAGVAPGGVVLMNASAQGLPVNSGLLVLYSDDDSFTFMTPEGCPEAGWIMCSAYEENGATFAQVRTQGRANDPVFEIGFRMFGAKQQERIWTYVLKQLAARFSVQAAPTVEKLCLDPRFQWSRAGNVWQNATIRSFFYAVSHPFGTAQRRA